MQTLLEKCKSEHKMTSIFRNSESASGHFTGYIAASNECEVLIEHITPTGLYDGYIVLPMVDISRVDCDGNYESKIEKLYSLKKQVHKKIEIKDEYVLCTVLEFAKENGYIVCAEMEEDVRGLVKELSNDWILLEKVTDDGILDGLSMIRLDDINLFAVDTEEEQTITALMQYRMK